MHIWSALTQRLGAFLMKIMLQLMERTDAMSNVVREHPNMVINKKQNIE